MTTRTGHQKIKSIIAIASGKGGVGKSTVATNLAHALNRLGHKVGLLDADIYGPSQPRLLGNREHPMGHDGLIVPIEQAGIKFISMGALTSSGGPVIMRAPMAVSAINQFLTGVEWGELDYLLLDLPPGTGDIQLTIAQQVSLSGVVIITTPQKMASEIAKLGLQMFAKLNVPVLGVVENMSGFTCSHCHGITEPFRKGGGRNLAKETGVPFLGEIPLDPNIMLSSDEGTNLQDLSEGHVGEIFLNLAQNLLQSEVNSRQTVESLIPEKIEHDEINIRLSWRDGIKTEIDAYTLRTLCPCALCVDERTGKKILRNEDVPLTIKALNLRTVGRYGLMVDFSDGHNKGIYRFSMLKQVGETAQDNSVTL